MNRRTTAAAGLAVTAGTAALVASASSYDLGAGVLVGTAAGASVALVPTETPGRKIAGFLTGMAVAAGAYLLRAGLLPDSSMGALIGMVVAFAAVTVISILSNGRTPLWASFAGVLVGIAAMAGAYEMLHILDFAGLAANLPLAATGVLLASAVGFTAASLFAPSADATAKSADAPGTDTELEPAEHVVIDLTDSRVPAHV